MAVFSFCVILGKHCLIDAVRLAPDGSVHFAGFEGEYPSIFNRKTREMGATAQRRWREFISGYPEFAREEKVLAEIHRAFDPLCGGTPRILILGTFPSPLSREKGEYYANPRNQFWRIIFAVLGLSYGAPDYDAKKAALAHGGIAVWDVITSCEAENALDSSIKNPVYNTGIPAFISRLGISAVFFNGGNAYAFYRRGIGETDKNVLPSTSPANARMRFDEKLCMWQSALNAFF